MGIKSITAGLSLFLLAPAPALLAQGAVNTPGSPTASGGATQQPADSVSSPADSERVIVNDVPIEQSILPTTRPIDSVYGLDTSVLDTPRNVTIISREQLSAVDIQDPRDFSKLTSDSYTQSNFGAPANPSIRGQTADVFINGMRRGLTSNGNGFPIDFNSVESVDIIKGPANAVYGASQYVGGYVDEVTKQPYFDKFQGNIGTTIGEYQVYRWTADFGGPLIKDQLAYRVSYTGEDSGSYYDDSHKQSEAVYAAITWMPNSKFTLALNGEYDEADYNENNGINRVTQNLIDNDKYITGTVPGGNAAIQPFFNPVDTTGQVNLDHALHIIGSQDGSYGHTEYVQALQTYTANENFKIINNTLYERVDRRTFNSQQFDEVLKDNAAVEDRLEFIFDTDIPIGGGTMKDLHASKDAKDGKDAKEVAKNMDAGSGGLTFHNQLNTGLDFRYQNNTNYDTFADEPFDAFDITKPISTVYIPSANVAAAFPGQYHVPGQPSEYLFSPTNGDNAHSEFYELGPYFQDILKFNDQFSILFGGRADLLYVQSETPPGTPVSVYETNTTTQVLPSANISPTYKPFSFLTTYFTFNFSQSTNTGDGGDYSPTFTSSDYHQQSFLYEVGAKFSLLKNTLFFTGTGYIQNRENPSIGGTSVKVNVNGLEFEANYQPNKHIYATTSYSLLDAHTVDPGFVHEYVPITLSDSVPPGTVLLTDVPPPGFAVPNGHYRTPGYPEHLFNGLVSYKTDFGLGATADIQVTSPMTLSYDGNTKIHWQYNMDFSVFYTYKRYEARVGIYNATNQHNWNPANPIYGNESIFADEPIHVEGTFKIKF